VAPDVLPAAPLPHAGSDVTVPGQMWIDGEVDDPLALAARTGEEVHCLPLGAGWRYFLVFDAR
jgi:hypothetical protein